MADDAFVVDRREFILASVAGLATAAGCNSTGGDGGSNDTDEDPTLVRVGYGGVPVEADLEPIEPEPTDDPTDPDSDTGTDDPGDAGHDGGGAGGSGGGGGGGGYGGGGGGGYGSGGGGSGGDESQPTIPFVQVDADLYGAPYNGQSAEDIPYDDPEDDPCLGYGRGPYGGMVEEGETPACREAES